MASNQACFKIQIPEMRQHKKKAVLYVKQDVFVLISRNPEGNRDSAEELGPVARDHGGAQGLPVRHDQTVQ